MSRRETGCSGCGDPGHTVAGCLTEAAAAFYERTGRANKAASIRRQLQRAADREARVDLLRERAEARRS